MKSRFVLGLALVALAVAPASASAYNYAGSFQFQGGTTPGSFVGGGTGANINDFWWGGSPADAEVSKNYRLRFPKAWVQEVWQDALRRECKTSDGFCRTSPSIYRPQAAAKTLGSLTQAGNKFNRGLAGRIGWVNKCAVEVPVMNSNPCVEKLFGASGNNSWGEVHASTPQGATPQIQGTPVFMSVRVWRSCSFASGSFSTAGSTDVAAKLLSSNTECEVSPIFERTIPYTDGSSADAPTQAGYFRQTRSDGVNDPGKGRTAFEALTSHTRSAGVLYGACPGTVNAPARYYCQPGKRNGAYRGAVGGDSFEDRCDAGLLPTSMKWSTAELVAEAKALRLSDAKIKAIRDWSAGGRKSSVFPPGISTYTACKRFTEHLAMSWDVRPGKSPALKWSLSAIPHRLYAVQVVLTDSRENVLSQNFEVGLGAATVAPGTPGPSPECPTTHPYYPTCSSSGTPDPVALSADPAVPNLTVEFPKTQLIGQPANGHVRSVPGEPTAKPDTGDEYTDVDSSGYSMWLPRTLHFSIHNTDDSKPTVLPTPKLPGATPKVLPGGKSYPETHATQMQRSGDPFAVGDLAATTTPSGRHVSGDKAAYAAQAPVINTGDGMFGNDLDVRVARATRAVNAADAFNVGVRAVADEARYVTMAGEARFNRSWRLNAEGGPESSKYDWQRFTCDDTYAAGDIGSGAGDPTAPRVMLRGEPVSAAGPCNPERDLNGHNKIKHAYTIPALEPNTQIELSALFEQSKTGPAHLQLITSNPRLKSMISDVEVWDYDSYIGRTPGDRPLYRVPTDMGFNAAGYDGMMNFCHPTLTRKVKKIVATPTAISMGIQPYRHKNWVGTVYGMAGKLGGPMDSSNQYFITNFDPQADIAMFNNDRWINPGNRYMNGNLVASDVKWYKRKDTAPKDRPMWVRREAGEAAPSTTNYDFDAWGREWWHVIGDPTPPSRHAEDLGPFELFRGEIQNREVEVDETYRNPDCGGHPSGTAPDGNVSSDPRDLRFSHNTVILNEDGSSTPSWELDEGRYVVVYKITVPGGTSLERTENWGLRGKLQQNTTAQWISQYDVQQVETLTSIFRSRAIG